MLRTLLIKNFILILDAKIEFSDGLNIITGESGSGKSALLRAIDAVFGSKIDPSCIFPNKNSAVIEAVFEVRDNTELQKVLSDYDIGKVITLRRELSKTGRSRFFINDQLVSLTQIKECAIFFADYISQKQAASLSQDKYIKSFVDSLADCKKELNVLFKLWNQANTLLSEINNLSNQKISLVNAIPSMKDELSLIEKVNYKPDEEKDLEEEYVKLINSQEQKEHFVDICNQIADEPDSVLTKLRQIDKKFQRLLVPDSKAESLYKSFQSAFIELKDLSFELSKVNSSIDADFNSLTIIENRIKEIDLLKKKFGNDLTLLEVKKAHLLKSLDNFEEIDESVDQLNLKLQTLNNQINDLCLVISTKRTKSKTILEKKMQSELSSLNLNNCTFELLLEKKLRSASGDENPNFLFSANLNTKLQPLQKVASGGELARVMLALKCIILDKDPHHCLIFDEIDANVGGKSAAVIGDKLLKLSQHKQIICVTHFVQVAKKATAHFLIEKSQQNQQSLSLISKLDDQQKDLEYQRMLGQVK